jgi:hypothetical protein
MDGGLPSHAICLPSNVMDALKPQHRGCNHFRFPLPYAYTEPEVDRILMAMAKELLTKDHFFGLAERDLKDADLLMSTASYENALRLLAEANEMAGKGLLCQLGFVYDRAEITEIKKRILAAPVNPQTQPKLIELLDALDEILVKYHISTKRDLLRKYGHEWQRIFVQLLLVVSPNVEAILMAANMLAMMKRPQALADQPIWHTGDFEERVEKVRNKMGDQAHFRNPPLSEVDQVIASSNALLDSLKSYQYTDDEAKQMFRVLLGDVPQVQEVTASMVRTQSIGCIKLVVLGDLGVYLTSHHSLVRYQDEMTDFNYDENLAVVKRHKEISALLTRCVKEV